MGPIAMSAYPDPRISAAPTGTATVAAAAASAPHRSARRVGPAEASRATMPSALSVIGATLSGAGWCHWSGHSTAGVASTATATNTRAASRGSTAHATSATSQATYAGRPCATQRCIS